MIRFIGDFYLKFYGVISIFEIYRFKLDYKKDFFIVFYIDGVSYVMSDKEIIDVVRICFDVEYVVNILISCVI